MIFFLHHMTSPLPSSSQNTPSICTRTILSNFTRGFWPTSRKVYTSGAAQETTRPQIIIFSFHETTVTMLQKLSLPPWWRDKDASKNVSMCQRFSWSKWKKSTGQRRNQTLLNKKKTWSVDVHCTAVSSATFAESLLRWCCGRDTSCFRIYRLRLHSLH